MPDLQLNHDQKMMLAELGDGEVIDAIIEGARQRVFKEFEKADPMERMQIGAKLDALADVRRELQSVINEASESGRIARIQ